MRRLMTVLRRDQRGTTAVEFAFVAPILIAMVLFVVELSLMMFVNTVVEGGLREASRIGLTGYSSEGVSRDQLIVNVVNEHSLGMVTVNLGDIHTYVYPSFADIGQPEPFEDGNGNEAYDEGEDFTDINGNGVWDPDMGKAGLGGASDIVIYTLDYDWSFLTKLLTIPMQASIVVRNEPYGTSP